MLIGSVPSCENPSGAAEDFSVQRSVVWAIIHDYDLVHDEFPDDEYVYEVYERCMDLPSDCLSDCGRRVM